MKPSDLVHSRRHCAASANLYSVIAASLNDVYSHHLPSRYEIKRITVSCSGFFALPSLNLRTVSLVSFVASATTEILLSLSAFDICSSVIMQPLCNLPIA